MGDTILIETTADEVVSIVTQGPQGPSGSEAATLTTTGDMLYRAALANDRLPIGSEGQVLKVSGGLPAWGNESGAVTSVNGETGAVVLDAADVGAAPASGIDPNAISGTAVVDSDARLSDSRSPTAHAASHATGGTDALAPSDIGAQSLFSQLLLSTPTDATPYALSATRAVSVRVFTTEDYTVRLPESGHLTGDIIEIRADTLSATKTLTIEKGVGSTAWSGIATITSQGGKRRFVATGTGRSNWLEDSYFTTNGNLGAPSVHEHTASDITSGTLAHERGGLEADVSAYNGLVKISGGSTSAVTVTAAGEALLDDADAAAQRTTLGLGNSATLDTGTTAGTVAEGNHTHTQLHDKSHAMTDATSHTAGNHKVFYSNGSGEIVELALGNSGEVLTSNGATSAPSFAAASGGIGGGTGSVDNALLRADGTGGSTAQAADIVIDDATTSTQANVAIRNNHSETNSALVLTPKGTGAFILGPKPNGASTGGNARGSRAVDLQMSRNFASDVAAGSSSFAAGASNRATSAWSAALGTSNNAGGLASMAFGYLNTSSAAYSCCLGMKSVADRTALFAQGIGSNTSGTAGNWPNGAAQRISSVLRCKTTTDTPVILALDAQDVGAIGLGVPSGKVMSGIINCVGVKSDGSDVARYVRQFTIKNVGGTTALVGSVITIGTDEEDNASTDISVTADDTNDRLKIEVTGIASETWRWVASVDAVEVAYGS